MRTWMFAISIGIGLSMLLPALLGLEQFVISIFIVMLSFVMRRYRLSVIISGAVIGLLWGGGYAHWRVDHILPIDQEGKDQWVEGEIIGLPTTSNRRGMLVRRFDLKLTSSEMVVEKELQHNPSEFISPVKIRLSWYGGPELASGMKCRLKVRLKQPHGFANPGGFDYQVWLLERGIDAVGYVRKDKENSLGYIGREAFSIDRIRYGLRERIHRLLADNAYKGVITALVMGDKSAISLQQWELFSHTGTSHLVAISGLHVGLIALVGYFLFYQLARTNSWLLLRFPAQCSGAIGAIFAGFSYSALAGFSLPTTRACIMLTVLMSARLLRREWRISNILLLAILLILIANPLTVYSYGFWLSFMAVASLLFAFGCRLGATGIVQRWIMPQWIVFVGLMPFMLMFFNNLPWFSPIANFIAIPVYSFLVVPLSLAGAATSYISESWAEALLFAAAKVVELVSNSLLYLIERFEWWGEIPAANLTPLTLAALVFGMLLLLCPSFMPGRWLAWLLIVVPWLVDRPQLPEGQFEVNVLDVGQGLSVVVHTRNHLLVYDTGAHYSESFDLGLMVVEPFLLDRGDAKIDRLVISHNDNDHVGGLDALLTRIPVDEILAGEELRKDGHRVTACKEGMIWDWDGVQFQVLHGGIGNSANNRSCVIKVSSSLHSVLLSGDIEKRVETKLITEYGEDLKADIVIAPHHGSNTSSSKQFLSLVAPDYAVFSAGYRNSFNHPHPKVVARYEYLGATMFNTAFAGSVKFSEESEDKTLTATAFRDLNRRFWYAGSPFQVRL